jgi:ribulose-phosphate 3-epimerase
MTLRRDEKMLKIAPSILSADFCNLERDIRRVSSADWLHVDVMDGMFVPNITIGVPVVESIRQHTDLFLDVHLMVEKPGRYVEAFARAGADLLSVHLEADMPPFLKEALHAMDQCGVKKAVALRPITAAEAVLPYLELGVDLVLVMTVEPGFGGQKFMADQLPKIAAVRRYIEQYRPGCDLEVDGGINAQTARQVIDAGANVLVAGSAVYGADDPAAAIAALRG